MNKKLAIITINFNDKKGLLKTFESIKIQTWKEFEYIVIDGGSTDGSKEIIEENPQISYWISEKDTGVYNALNKGVKAAKADYLIFMNSGDTFYDQNVLQNIEYYFEKGIGVLYGNSAYYKNDVFIRSEIPPNNLSFNFFFNFSLNHQATFIKRELFEKHFYYNESYKICADWEFFTYVLCAKNESYLYINQYICNYDLSGISADPNNKSLYESEREQTLKKYFPLMYEDYIMLKQLEDKRIRNMIYIKKFKISWRILKAFSKIILLFLPKQKN